MDEKLKELTEIIVKEGVDKANEKAQAVLAQAQDEADQILHQARKEADDTIALAHRRAEEVRKNAEAELKLASRQIISNLKQRITDLLLVRMLNQPVQGAFNANEFLAQLILEIARNWKHSASERVDLKVLLPEARFQEVEKFLEQRGRAVLAQGLKIEMDKQMQNGFQVAPLDGGFKLNFSEHEFMEFFKNSLRAKTQALLFEAK
jgi:V/A-type H+-transporting ATPase subunit E